MRNKTVWELLTNYLKTLDGWCCTVVELIQVAVDVHLNPEPTLSSRLLC